MSLALRFPYVDLKPSLVGASRMPYVPLTLTNGSRTIHESGLLDTGATINVLPYPIGIQLGLDWTSQKTPVQLSGNLAAAPTYAIVVTATIGSFPSVRLAFAWTQAANIPIILGQINFFLAFDVCFFRTLAEFELRPSQKPQ